MTTFPFRPGRDFAILRREMDRLFDDATAGDRSSAQTVWSPRADVAEADDAYFLTLDLPGIDRDALDVTFDDGTLKISGERQHTAERTGARAHRVERAHRHRHVAWIGRDAAVGRADHAQLARKTVDRGAAIAGLALVARLTLRRAPGRLR